MHGFFLCSLTINHTISIRMMKGDIRKQNKTPQKDEQRKDD